MTSQNKRKENHGSGASKGGGGTGRSSRRGGGGSGGRGRGKEKPRRRRRRFLPSLLRRTQRAVWTRVSRVRSAADGGAALRKQQQLQARAHHPQKGLPDGQRGARAAAHRRGERRARAGRRAVAHARRRGQAGARGRRCGPARLLSHGKDRQPARRPAEPGPRRPPRPLLHRPGHQVLCPVPYRPPFQDQTDHLRCSTRVGSVRTQEKSTPISFIVECVCVIAIAWCASREDLLLQQCPSPSPSLSHLQDLRLRRVRACGLAMFRGTAVAARDRRLLQAAAGRRKSLAREQGQMRSPG